jgi:hypothetical protein
MFSSSMLACKMQMVGEWMREVAVASRRYKNELLAAVLDLLLSSPPSIFPAKVILQQHMLASSWLLGKHPM